MRRSGRTAKMLLELGKYITEHWDEHKKIYLVTNTIIYSHDLIRNLSSIIQPTKKISATCYVYGNIKLYLFSKNDWLEYHMLRGIKWDNSFIDHHMGRSND